MSFEQERAQVVRLAYEAAAAFGGTVSGLSAAVAHGWDVKLLPSLPHLTVARNRRLPVEAAEGARIRRLDLPPEDVQHGVTTTVRTVVDCLRQLAFDEGLVIADSALRHRVPRGSLEAAAVSARGPASIKVRRVMALADRRSANAFESVLRAICLAVPGLAVEPQVRIGGTEFLGTPDLVDVNLGIAIEAESFEWHGERRALAADARRYNDFSVSGWLVLRFTWGEVMHRPQYVFSALTQAVALRTNRVGRDGRVA